MFVDVVIDQAWVCLNSNQALANEVTLVQVVWIPYSEGREAMLFDSHNSAKAVNPQTGHIRASVRDLMTMLKDPEITLSSDYYDWCVDDKEELLSKYVRVIQTRDELMLQRLFSSYEEGPYATVSVIKPSRSRTYGEVTVSRQSLMARLGNFSPDDVVRLTQYKNNTMIENLNTGKITYSSGIAYKDLPFLPSAVEQCVAEAKVSAKDLLVCFDCCDSSVADVMLKPDAFAYLHLTVSGNKRVGNLSAIGMSVYGLMHFASQVRGQFADDREVFITLPKHCLDKLRVMLRGQDGMVEIAATPSGGYLAYEQYRIHFSRPETPLPDLNKLDKEVDKATSRTVFNVSGLQRALMQNRSICLSGEGEVCLKREGDYLSVSLVVDGELQGEKSLLRVESFSGKDPNFYINAWMLNRAIENVNSDRVELRGYPNADKPICFKGLGDPYWVLIVRGVKMR